MKASMVEEDFTGGSLRQEPLKNYGQAHRGDTTHDWISE